MLEVDLESARAWWKDKDFTDELNQRYKGWKAGSTKEHTIADIDRRISAAKAGSR